MATSQPTTAPALKSLPTNLVNPGGSGVDWVNNLKSQGYDTSSLTDNSPGGKNYTPPTPTATPAVTQPVAPGQPVNTSQPSTQPTSITPGVGNNTMTPSVGYDQALKNLQSGGLKGNDLAGATQDLKSKYQIGLSNAQGSGKAAPQSSGAGSAGVQANIPPPSQPQYDPTKVDSAMSDVSTQAGQAHQQYINDYTQSQTSQAQTESLTQTYNDLMGQLGIAGLNTQLMNMKNIMDGTEQDIRNEVTKAGGFATNSQVLAMTDARNKTMQQNYNNLLQTRDDAQKNLTTMMDLTEKDRTYAQQKLDSQLNFDKQNIDYADKALTNARSAYDTMQKSEGWDGILKAAMASGDPTAIQRINSTMGPGFNLATMAKQDATARAQAAQKSNLELAQGYQNLSNSKLSGQKTSAEIQKMNEDNNIANGVPVPAKANKPGFNPQGVKYTPTSASQAIVSAWKTLNAFDKNGAITPAAYNQQKAWWTAQGLSSTEFDSILGQYKNDQTNKQYN